MSEAARLEGLHPSLWRASQLGRSVGKTVDTGYTTLSAQLPGAGWPRGALIELLASKVGVGELRLLAPALRAVADRPIAILQPPHVPSAQGLAYVGLPLSKLLLLKASKTADILWSAEQVLKAGTCGALVMWQQYIQPQSLRRLQVAAKSSDALFFMMRPLAASHDPSPAELRIALKPAPDGVYAEILKRRGSVSDGPLLIDLRPSPILLSPHGRSRRVIAGENSQRHTREALTENI
jgi:protein ImuA